MILLLHIYTLSTRINVQTRTHIHVVLQALTIYVYTCSDVHLYTCNIHCGLVRMRTPRNQSRWNRRRCSSPTWGTCVSRWEGSERNTEWRAASCTCGHTHSEETWPHPSSDTAASCWPWYPVHTCIYIIHIYVHSCTYPNNRGCRGFWGSSFFFKKKSYYLGCCYIIVLYCLLCFYVDHVLNVHTYMYIYVQQTWNTYVRMYICTYAWTLYKCIIRISL